MPNGQRPAPRHSRAVTATCRHAWSGTPGHQLVAVARGGGRGPLVQPLDVRAELARRSLAAERVEQRVLLVLRPVAQLVQAQVVVAPLEDGEPRRAPERLAQRLGEPGQVALDELALQRDGGRGDHDGPALVRGEPQRGHQVGERLARPGACLHGEVRPVGHRVPDRLRHDGLPGALRPADRGDGGSEQRLYRGESVHGEALPQKCWPRAETLPYASVNLRPG